MPGRRPGHRPPSCAPRVSQASSWERPAGVSPREACLEVYGAATPQVKPGRRLAPPATPRRARRPGPRDPGGRESESITFISGSAEAPLDSGSCCLPRPWVWNLCKAVFCFRRCRACYQRCGGCVRSCEACLPALGPSEPSADEGWGKEHNGGPAPRSPAVSAPSRHDRAGFKSAIGSSFSYPDVKLKGIPVYPYRGADADSCHKEPLAEQPARRSLPGTLGGSPRSSEEYYSFHESDLDLSEMNGGSMSSREIDVLIFKKLTELFSMHQIDELAKCTSDTVFLEKTNKISDLISSITQDYHLDEQDAECRLVRGIIRISTRKSRNRPATACESRLSRGPAPDSGTDTMVASVLSQDELTVQISQETTSDAIARKLRPYGAPGYPPSHDSSFQGTETDSSGAPLLQVYC
ncbi:keratinocyte differentiation factor 1 [Antechinus flavipes]|uniref:keratinocyte differentiation factor 1 n=1 Tax=Antechinus flavipes TaxID=38775 RepID=UPI00223624DD|nr:keratinocyte differentiation factor 1 [Antechinus flavipes]XP_051844054.1 keratinocyte differentiation factor 1 [Antechinus flavipes]